MAVQGMPLACVKNTFLEFVDAAPVRTPFRRTKSEPAAGCADLSDFETHSGTCSSSSEISSTEAWTEQQGEASLGSECKWQGDGAGSPYSAWGDAPEASASWSVAPSFCVKDFVDHQHAFMMAHSTAAFDMQNLMALSMFPVQDTFMLTDASFYATDADDSFAPELESYFDSAEGVHRVTWSVDLAFLGSDFGEVGSPSFTVSLCPEVRFELVLLAHAGLASAEPSFRKSRGRGRVQLRCLDAAGPAAASLGLRFGIGRRSPRWIESVTHNFAVTPSCAPGANSRPWELQDLADHDGHCVAISIEISPAF